METDRLLKQLAFIHEIDKLKYIFRKSKLFSSNRNENDAEHSWHLAVMAIILAEHSNEAVDLLKVIKMLLVHDIVEIDAGDVFLFDTTARVNNQEAEIKAAARIFGFLPEDQCVELTSLWKEFEEGNTPEARFAQAIDRLHPVLQNISNGGGSWKEFNVKYESVINKNSAISNGSRFLWDFAERRINETITPDNN
jgi:putative hydrolases of HD superfamily